MIEKELKNSSEIFTVVEFNIRTCENIFQTYSPISWKTLHLSTLFANIIMKIIDPHSLVPNPLLLQEVIRNHPFCTSMIQMIDEIIIDFSEEQGMAKENIRPELENRKVFLGIETRSSCKENFEYILYHEFGHVADRLDPRFGYSDELKGQLSDAERVCVMEIWNVYIDSRLNRAGLFHLGYQLDGYSTINGKRRKTPKGIEGKLLDHIAMMETFGVPHPQTDKIVRTIWENPPMKLPYPEIIRLVRGVGGEPAASADG